VRHIAFYGLKRKLGRYPIGAVESSATKLYGEMLASGQVGAWVKLESLFMISYYPMQLLVALVHMLVLVLWAAGMKPMSVVPWEWILGLLWFGLVAHDPTGADLLAMLPFAISSLVWGFSVLLWVPRRWGLWTPLDLIGEVVAIVGVAVADIVLSTIRWTGKKGSRTGEY